jgi:hypothetical protein
VDAQEYDGCMAMQDDPWSALQKPGSEAMDEQQARIAPAYATRDDRGYSIAGFDLAMTLPPVCVKCGGASHSRVLMPIQIKMDFATAVITAPDGAELEDKIGPGEYPLRLPYCERCAHRRQLAIKLRWAKLAFPLVFVAAFVAAAVLSDSLIGLVVLLAFVGGIALWAVSGVVWKKSMVRLERLDSDGFIRLQGVHPDAGEAIVAASLAKPTE